MNVWYRSLRWYDAPWVLLLAPLMLIYAGLSAVRRAQYMAGQRPICNSAAPVVVVGNLSVGGTGKTPAALALVKALHAKGLRPAIISRGFGAECVEFPRLVESKDLAQDVGDEPLLLACRAMCPVVIDPERCRGIAYINETFAPDVIISDDGLQHYAMGRSIEIVVVDQARGFGNGYMMPLGPLREPLSRLDMVDAVWWNGNREQGFLLQPSAVVNVASGERHDYLEFAQQHNLVAVAGIGHPDRFFQQLRSDGFTIEERSFSDHHPYQEVDFDFAGKRSIIMTEKDAVKCRTMSFSHRLWYVEVEAVWHNSGLQELVDTICLKIGEHHK